MSLLYQRTKGSHCGWSRVGEGKGMRRGQQVVGLRSPGPLGHERDLLQVVVQSHPGLSSRGPSIWTMGF